MDANEFKNLIDGIECPEFFSEDGIGPLIAEVNDVNRFADNKYDFYPGDSNIEILKKYEKVVAASFEVHSHGLFIWVDDNPFIIGNDQIVVLDTVDHDEYITTKKNMAQYITFGVLLADGGIPGAIIGGAIGALFGIGKKTTHLKGTFIRIVFWDEEDRKLKYILLDFTGRKEDILGLLHIWEEQKEINQTTGRKPEEVEGQGCLGIIIALISLTTMTACYFL